MGYNFTVQWIKGNNNNAPDALSRNPVSDPQKEDMLAEYAHTTTQKFPLLKFGLLP